jgi:hypothetical protein
MSRLATASASLALVAGLILTASLLSGCGGGDGVAPNGGPHPSPDNATIQGKVVAADDVTVGIPGAVVSEPVTGQSATTDANGAFSLTGLPGGSVVLTAESPESGDYRSTSVRIKTLAHRTTAVSLAMIPAALGTPTSLALDPQSPSVQVGGSLQFRASIYVGADKVDIQPTWVVENPATGDIGQVTAAGVFQGLAAGTATVSASVGGLYSATSVNVTGPLPPQITSVLLSASKELPISASGGQLTITAAISDADGINTSTSGSPTGLRFEVYGPTGAVTELAPGAPTAGTIYDGTWTLNYAVPPNSHSIGADGTQAPELYSVRVVARDLSGQVSYSAFYDFYVAGVDVPPPPA